MKFIKIVFISLLALFVILILALIIFVKTLDVNRFKPQIMDLASKALNRQVNFDKAKLDISLAKGIRLNVSNLVIADDHNFGKENFLAVKNISLAFDALGYILQKKIKVPNIFIDSPHIIIIRHKDGSINLESIAIPSLKDKEIIKPLPAAAPLVIPAVFISYLKGTNASVKFVDYSFEPLLNLEISDLSFAIDKISLTEAFPFVVEAAFLSDKKNIRIEGNARVNLRTNEIIISEAKATTDLSQILLDKVATVFPMAKGAILPVGLTGKAEAGISKLTFGPEGLKGLAADVSVPDGSIRFKEIPKEIKGVLANMKITEKDIFLDKVSAGIGEGIITVSGSLLDYLTAQNYNLAVDFKDLRIEDLAAQDKAPVKVEGVALGKINLKGQGFNPDQFMENLSGEMDIFVTKGKLKDLNVLRTILEKISVIPGLVEKLEAGLPEEYKQKLIQKDTNLSDIKLPLLIENSRLIIRDAVLGAEGFIFKGTGEAGFDGVYSLEGSFLIPQDLSLAIVAQASQIQYLLNEDKQVYIPLKIFGKAGEFKFKVDTEYLTKKLLSDQAKNQISNLLDKVLGGKEEGTPQEGTPQEGAPQGKPDEKTRIKEAVSSVLGNIFGN